MTRFTDTTVLVTGGTGGQGAAHIRAFHAEGANVVIGATDVDRGVALASELGSRAIVTRLDVTDEKLWAAAVSDALHPGARRRCHRGDRRLLLP